MRAEITPELVPPSNPDDLYRLHGLVNIIGIVRLQLAGFERDRSLAEVDRAITRLLQAMERLDAMDSVVAASHAARQQVASAAARQPLLPPHVKETLGRVCRIWEERDCDLLQSGFLQWRRFDSEAVRTRLVELFETMALCSEGRFSVTQHADARPENAYWLDLAFECDDPRGFTLPPALLDVQQDLLANARKFTHPGGHLASRLVQLGQVTRLEVQDDGRGIPSDEVFKVFFPGVRGSNTSDVRRNGAGQGLTRALAVTRALGGRLWLETELGQGTRVWTEIPRPPSC